MTKFGSINAIMPLIMPAEKMIVLSEIAVWFGVCGSLGVGCPSVTAQGMMGATDLYCISIAVS